MVAPCMWKDESEEEFDATVQFSNVTFAELDAWRALFAVGERASAQTVPPKRRATDRPAMPTSSSSAKSCVKYRPTCSVSLTSTMRVSPAFGPDSGGWCN